MLGLCWRSWRDWQTHQVEARTRRYAQLSTGWREATMLSNILKELCCLKLKNQPFNRFLLQLRNESIFIETFKCMEWTRGLFDFNMNPAVHYTMYFSLLTLGLISMVRNSLKLGWGVRLWSFFSRETSQLGARWTFFSMTQRPDLLEALMALSACVNPSAEPTRNPTMNFSANIYVQVTLNHQSTPTFIIAILFHEEL